MGGLLFSSPINDVDRSIGKTVAEAKFLDNDGVPILVQLNLDKNNQLFEFDVWKVDYSPVSRWQELDQIVIESA